jgi:hypothetical protein
MYGCIGYQKAEGVEEELLEILDREAENSDSLEVQSILHYHSIYYRLYMISRGIM